MAKESKGHRWRFFRAGGFDQVRLDRGEDLLALSDLDQKLWVALSCPVHGLEFDEKTLELIDTDKDGRIRAPEVLAAVKWACSVVKSPDSLLKRSPSLPLDVIDDSTEDGKRLLASAKEILKNLDKSGDKVITIEDTADTAKIFSAMRFNGDGVVPVASADDAATAKVIEDIIACVGSVVDRSGAPGVNTEKVTQFFAEADAYSGWWAAAEADAANVLPLGDRTPDAADALRAVKMKIDDYFARGRLLAFDARSSAALNRDESEYVALAAKELSATAQEVASFPLSKIEANKSLALRSGLNPAWADAMHAFVTKVVEPVYGGPTETPDLDETEWRELGTSFAPYEAWRAKKAGLLVEKLGHDRIREILASDAKAKVEDLIAQDKALEPEAAEIAAVDRLIRYHRDLDAVLNNFVTFRDFYGKKKALFQAGTLYLDARSCDLCIRVKDAAAHATLATRSGTYLAYCDCTRKDSPDKLHIVAAVTDGHGDDLVVGRNGIFYDRKGQDWDATVVKLVTNPISTREAFWLPYKRIAKLVGDQIEKFASSRDKEMHDKAATSIADTGKAIDAPAAAVAPAPVAAAPPEKSFDIGTIAVISLAIGTVTTAITTIVLGFMGLAWWKMLLVVPGIVTAISGPSVILAWLKLHRRTVGPLLDGNGWAVNAHAKLNIPFGASLTAVATLPPNAERSLDDPFAEPQPKWKRYVTLVTIALALGAAWHFGILEMAWDKLKASRPVAAPAASASASSGPAAPAPAKK